MYFLEFFIIISNLLILIFLGNFHVYLLPSEIMGKKNSLYIFNIFFIFQLCGVIILHIVTGLINDVPLYQWGNMFGGDEINFFNDMKFFHNRYDGGDLSYDLVNKDSQDTSLWIYLISFFSYGSNLPFYKMLLPKFVNVLFTSLTCSYACFFLKNANLHSRMKVVMLVFLLTPDYYYLSSSLFRAPFISYLIIIIFYILTTSQIQLKKGLYLSLTVLLIIVFGLIFFVIPSIRIWLNVLIIIMIISCFILNMKHLKFIIVTPIILIAAVYWENIFIIFENLSGDSLKIGTRILIEQSTTQNETSLALRILEYSVVGFIAANLLQFFISVPFWNPLVAFPGEARSYIEFAVIIFSHLSMGYFFSGLFDLKKTTGKYMYWIIIPIMVYSLALAIASGTIIRWRFPILPFITIVIANGFDNGANKKAILSYLFGLLFVYLIYFYLK